jgi:hypothetical protein
MTLAILLFPVPESPEVSGSINPPFFAFSAIRFAESVPNRLRTRMLVQAPGNAAVGADSASWDARTFMNAGAATTEPGLLITEGRTQGAPDAIVCEND